MNATDCPYCAPDERCAVHMEEGAHKPIRDVRPGDQAINGWTYLSEPCEQPDGSWSIMAHPPSGPAGRRLLDFDSGDADSEVPS